MQHKSYDLKNKFIIIVTTYKEYFDNFIGNTEHTVFDNNEFDMITALITMTYGIKYNYYELAKEYIIKYLKSTNRYTDNQRILELYLNKFNVNITEDDVKNIMNKIDDFIPEYDPCEGLSDVIIVKNNKLLEILKPTNKDIEQAIQYIANHLDDLKN